MLGNLFIRIVGVFFIPLLWILFADLLGLANPEILPPFKLVLEKLYLLLSSSAMGHYIFATLKPWLLGTLLGASLGVAFGTALGNFAATRQLFSFSLNALLKTPAIALLPLFAMLLGSNEKASIVLSLVPSFLILSLLTSQGIREKGITRFQMAKVYGASSRQIANIAFKEALPKIFLGLRLSLPLTLILSIASELILKSSLGLGAILYEAYRNHALISLYAVILIIGAIGYIVSELVIILEKQATFWRLK